MALKKRERVLAAVTGVLVLAVVAAFFFSGSGGSLAALRAERDKKTADLEEKKNRVLQAEAARAKLAQWQKRSLPTDTDVARTLYENWLRELVDQVKFDGAKIAPGAGQLRKSVFARFNFQVQCQGSLDQLTRFLHLFYSAGHLHQIRRIDVAPLEGSEKLKVLMNIEAMSLLTADRRDKLTSAPPERPPLHQLPEYQKTIVGRNMFASYKPDTPPPVARRDPPREKAKQIEPKPPEFDHLKFTKVTGIQELNHKAQVWLIVQTTGKQFNLSQGESFDIGKAHGTVLRIDAHKDEVEIAIDGQRRRLRLGDSLREGAGGEREKKDSPPAAKGEEQAKADTTPAAKDESPAAKDATRVAKEEGPAAKEAAPEAKDATPEAKDKGRPGSDRRGFYSRGPRGR